MESFGLRSRRQRQRRGITLQDISNSTKIRVHYLQAIEQERLDQLPGGIICRGFVRAYARCVGVDDEPAIEGFLAAYELNKTQLVPVVASEPFIQRCWERAMLLPLWVLAPALFALGLGLVNVGHELRQRYDSYRESSMEQVVSNKTPISASESEAKVARSSDISANKGLASEHLGQQLALRQQDRFSATTASPAPSQSSKFTISIQVREDAWMSIIADGRRLLSETLVAPTERLVEAHDQIVVRAGNIGAVDFSFNGKRLPAQGDYNEARTLAFDVNGLQARRANDPPRLAPPASIQPVPASVEQ
jgi:cytoskeleton protein RodZ